MPPLVAVTSTTKSQELLAGIVPPVRVTVDVLVEAVPPQVVLALPETTRPLGKVSVSGAVMVAAALSALLKVIVRVELPPALMMDGLKAFPTTGKTAATVLTVKVATAGAALTPLLVCNAPTASELM